MTAKEFAFEKHYGQIYGKDESIVPYVKHLQDVVDVLIRFGYSDEVILNAAWLHDSIEDTNTSYNDIKKLFGEEVAEMVYAVTDELGRNRKQRKSKTYPKIMANEKALLIKLADRIANIEYAIKWESNLGDMYKKEQRDFEITLRKQGVFDKLWDHLNGLLS